MRFLKDSPSIPDALLIARDEGRVVFFCGAGVSRARAGLPDFFGLADDVIRKLRVPSDNPACKILYEARKIDERTGKNSLAETKKCIYKNILNLQRKLISYMPILLFQKKYYHP